VSYCEVGGRAVFLDLIRDRYFALDPASNDRFLALARDGAIKDRSSPVVAKLLKLGLIRATGDGAAIASAPSSIPQRSAVDGVSRSGPNILAAAEIFVTLTGVRRRLRSGGLAGMITVLTGRKAVAGACRRPEQVEGLAQAFLGARRYVPLAPNCLSDSLALARYLARRKTFPNLVFGVKLDPFAAHCWLQTEATILNDASDRVREFVPVLVV
jgi:hypothetical protein